MSSMANDNIYPNFGAPFVPTPPAEQQISQDDKRRDTLSQLPVLREIVEHLDKQIAFYDSTKSIPEVVLTKPEEFMHTVAAHKLLVPILEQEKRYIQGRIDGLKP